MQSERQYQRGKLYQYDGENFVELEPSTDTKLPVSEEAAEVVKAVRKSAHQCIGLRPELLLTASAMLLAAAELSDIEERVRAYGQRVYGSPALREVTTPQMEVNEIPALPKPQGHSQQDQQPEEKPATTYLD